MSQVIILLVLQGSMALSILPHGIDSSVAHVLVVMNGCLLGLHNLVGSWAPCSASQYDFQW